MPRGTGRFSVELVGQFSGHMMAVPFVRFASLEQAQQWCDKQNQDFDSGVSWHPVDLGPVRTWWWRR